MKARADFYVVTRNGAPCQLIDLNVPRIPRIKNICVPSPVPPQPQRFYSPKAAQRACDRTANASRRLRESILVEYIREHFPLLRPLLTEAEYVVTACRKEAVK